MFEDWKEAVVSFVTSRIFVLMIVFLAFFGILLGRVFVLQIINGQQYAEDFTMKTKKKSVLQVPEERSLTGTVRFWQIMYCLIL